MLDAGLLALVENNAWTFGPNATALRLLDLTQKQRLDPATFWPEVVAGAPRLTPLAYWLNCHLEGGASLAEIREDHARREALMVSYLRRLLAPTHNVLLVGHDSEIDRLRAENHSERIYRYLLLEGPPGSAAPGESAHLTKNANNVAEPFPFARIEEALDWADAVVLSGFALHRQNLLGPSQLRPLLVSARDQVDRVLLTTTNERRYTLGFGAPATYRDDFRPYLWPAAVTHLVSEWRDGAAVNGLGWLPMPPDELAAQLGESFYSD